MRVRITVNSHDRRVATDAIIDCEPAEMVGNVLGRIAADLSLSGEPTIDGKSVSAAGPVAGSLLRSGAVVSFGAAPQESRDAWAEMLLTVESGPATGTAVDLTGRQTVQIGRHGSSDLVINDPSVSARHATLWVNGAALGLVDSGSKNGTFVDDRRITEAAPVGPDSVIQVGGSRLRIVRQGAQRLTAVHDGTGGWVVNRTPQHPPAWQPVSVEPPARADSDDEGRSLLVLAATMLVPLGLAVAIAAGTGQWRYALFGLLGPVLAGINFGADRSRTARRRRRRDEDYATELNRVEVAMQASADDEDAFLRRVWPDPREVLSAVRLPSTRLWSRRPGSDDWLRIRVGTADRPADIKLTRSGRAPTLTLPTLPAAPVGLSLDSYRVLGVSGEAAATQGVTAWAMLQCAALHGPDELSILVVGNNAPEYGWLRWLPHARAAWTTEQIDGLLGEVKSRLDAAEQHSTRIRSGALPVNAVVLLLNVSALAARDTIERLLERGPALGVAFVCVEADRKLLSRACRAEVQVRTDGSAVLEADGATTVTVDSLRPAQVEQAARMLAALRPGGASTTTGIPDVVHYFDLVGEPKVDGIRAAWLLNSERTGVPVGRDADAPFEVDIVADGPHGLIAGTTGSGKSQLLQTMLAGLALYNPPNRLNFLFIDYKGGATFLELESLPHVVGSVSNLDAVLAARALDSIETEQNRRQSILTAAGAPDYDAYQIKRRTNPQLAELSRLVVVVDEFAELKAALPDAAQRFESVARIGRTLGIHLILTAQNPTGVITTQIESNVGMRMSLRVSKDAESIEVIGIPDAATLSSRRMGQAYIKKRSDPARLVQVAWMGMPIGSREALPLRVVPVRWSDVDAPRPAEGTAHDDAGPTVLTELVRCVRAAGEAEHLVPPHRPWLPPLRSQVLLSTLAIVRHHLTVGLQDLPAVPAQRPLQIPLGSGHLAIVGSQRSGRTTALRSIAAGLALGGGVHLHVIDRTRQLEGLNTLPCCGVVVRPEDERTDRLLDRLTAALIHRMAALAARRLGTVAEWWTYDPHTAPSHIVLLVDGTTGLGVGANATGSEQRRTRFLRLLNDGPAAGITVVLATDEIGLRGLSTAFTYMALLQLNNPGDLSLPKASDARKLAALAPGRALWRADSSEVQIAALAAEAGTVEQNAALAQIASSTEDPADLRDLIRLDAMPDTEPYAKALTRTPPPRTMAALLGVGGDRLQSVWAPLAAGESIVVLGPRRSGRTTALASIAASLARDGGRVAIIHKGQHDAVDRAQDHGVEQLDLSDLDSIVASGSVDVVVVDDARMSPAHDSLLAALMGHGGPAHLRLVTGARGEDYDSGLEKLLKQAARTAVAKLVLCPGSFQYASPVGVRLDRDQVFDGPPGRGLVEVDGGDLLLVQVPDLAADAWEAMVSER